MRLKFQANIWRWYDSVVNNNWLNDVDFMYSNRLIDWSKGIALFCLAENEIGNLNIKSKYGQTSIYQFCWSSKGLSFLRKRPISFCFQTFEKSVKSSVMLNPSKFLVVSDLNSTELRTQYCLICGCDLNVEKKKWIGRWKKKLISNKKEKLSLCSIQQNHYKCIYKI